jgi:hypothetical protein
VRVHKSGHDAELILHTYEVAQLLVPLNKYMCTCVYRIDALSAEYHNLRFPSIARFQESWRLMPESKGDT